MLRPMRYAKLQSLESPKVTVSGCVLGGVKFEWGIGHFLQLIYNVSHHGNCHFHNR